MGLFSLRAPIVLAVCLSAPACTSSPEPPTSPASPDLELSLVSGDQQEGIPGAPLPSPFVVRVMDAARPVAGARVSWRVQSGAGVFTPSAATFTNANGEARVYFSPATHKATVTAEIPSVRQVQFRTIPRLAAVYALLSGPIGCDGDCERYTFYADSAFELRYPSGREYAGVFSRQDSALILSFSADSRWQATARIRGDTLFVGYSQVMESSDFEAAAFLLDYPGPTPPWAVLLSKVSGDDQPGEADAELRYPFEVRVTDSRGNGIGNQLVSWKVVSGSAELLETIAGQTTSEQHGLARATVRPTALGTVEVRAEVVGGNTPPVTFRINATCRGGRADISFYRDEWHVDDGFYLGGNPGPVTVPLGTTIVWRNANQVPDFTARIKSTAEPRGGEAFDSGILQRGESFFFTPKVEGTWNYVDQMSGVSGSLTVAGMLAPPRCG
jgi:Big-like domain-containing protein